MPATLLPRRAPRWLVFLAFLGVVAVSPSAAERIAIPELPGPYDDAERIVRLDPPALIGAAALSDNGRRAILQLHPPGPSDLTPEAMRVYHAAPRRMVVVDVDQGVIERELEIPEDGLGGSELELEVTADGRTAVASWFRRLPSNAQPGYVVFGQRVERPWVLVAWDLDTGRLIGRYERTLSVGWGSSVEWRLGRSGVWLLLREEKRWTLERRLPQGLSVASSANMAPLFRPDPMNPRGNDLTWWIEEDQGRLETMIRSNGRDGSRVSYDLRDLRELRRADAEAAANDPAWASKDGRRWGRTVQPVERKDDTGVWRVSDRQHVRPDLEVKLAPGFGGGSVSPDGQYLYFIGTQKPDEYPCVWRYDRNAGAWNTPRRLPMNGKPRTEFSVETGRLIAWDDKADRLHVYDWTAADRYDASLAQRMESERGAAKLAERAAQPRPREVLPAPMPNPVDRGPDRELALAECGHVMWIALSREGRRAAIIGTAANDPDTSPPTRRTPIMLWLYDVDEGRLLARAELPGDRNVDFTNVRVEFVADGRHVLTSWFLHGATVVGLAMPGPVEGTTVVLWDADTAERVAERTVQDVAVLRAGVNDTILDATVVGPEGPRLERWSPQTLEARVIKRYPVPENTPRKFALMPGPVTSTHDGQHLIAWRRDRGNGEGGSTFPRAAA